MGRLVGVTELDDQEKVDLLLIMLGAGIITTADLIGNTLHALLSNPSEMELLRRHRELVPEAIEETLRYDSPALSVGRILTEDRDFFGQLIPAGSWLRIMTAAVGRDPARNPDPERYWIQRPNREQYAFGGGVHFCLGLHLGKLEAENCTRGVAGPLPIHGAGARTGVGGAAGYTGLSRVQELDRRRRLTEPFRGG